MPDNTIRIQQTLALMIIFIIIESPYGMAEEESSLFSFGDAAAEGLNFH